MLREPLNPNHERAVARSQRVCRLENEGLTPVKNEVCIGQSCDPWYTRSEDRIRRRISSNPEGNFQSGRARFVGWKVQSVRCAKEGLGACLQPTGNYTVDRQMPDAQTLDLCIANKAKQELAGGIQGIVAVVRVNPQDYAKWRPPSPRKSQNSAARSSFLASGTPRSECPPPPQHPAFIEQI